ncbi:DUF3311 domain-containing protein [Burkholderia contaminans]|uniref:DUF3311 domain-containing protein n=1 Tax=Burkholderia contaminans TaxID=488447 RepID=A0AAP1YGU0_9BURK|nr:DUF3311 domain-containing protein [Burkholderia contaminans]MBK1913481.1 DUF3311 domain-containing protein [Burkholderia contaminans]MBK1927153.1 DUF3311 domain-containing protein [Burkholderia contaminans]MBK1935341.1 DUF3311 domain-containing protein [Burkholderia contaminans]MBK1943303.1 DUF3311 domain-containing protein [Burkholderia contaminans]
MAHDADANRAAKRWLWLLVLPLIAMVWVPSYSKIEPQWLGFPFFYWYQLLWVFIRETLINSAWRSSLTRPRAL